MHFTYVILTSLVALATSSVFRKGGWKKTHTKPTIDPETFMNFCQTTKYHGYHCTEFTNKIRTKDGYLLTLNRINGRRGSVPPTSAKPVLLQHGLSVDGYSWIMNPPASSLAYILVDAGYDVWISNSRGTNSSLKHVKYNNHEKEFWNFSWQQMALYDVPAFIDFVLVATGADSIPIIGHSQGTLTTFAYSAITKTKKVSHLIALAPIFHVGGVKGMFRMLVPFKHGFQTFFDKATNGSFLASGKFSTWLATKLFNRPLLDFSFEEALFLVVGKDEKYFNQTRLPVYAAHLPQGTSVQNIVHYIQMITSNTCSFYDYGSAGENMKRYNQTKPPVLTAKEVDLPVSLFSAENDPLADPEDVEYLRHNLPNLVNDVYIPDWNHGDFATATNLPTRLAGLVVAILDSL